MSPAAAVHHQRVAHRPAVVIVPLFSKPAPSKWDDAEKWISSPNSGRPSNACCIADKKKPAIPCGNPLNRGTKAATSTLSAEQRWLYHGARRHWHSLGRRRGRMASHVGAQFVVFGGAPVLCLNWIKGFLNPNGRSSFHVQVPKLLFSINRIRVQFKNELLCKSAISMMVAAHRLNAFNVSAARPSSLSSVVVLAPQRRVQSLGAEEDRRVHPSNFNLLRRLIKIRENMSSMALWKPGTLPPGITIFHVDGLSKAWSTCLLRVGKSKRRRTLSRLSWSKLLLRQCLIWRTRIWS